MNQKDYNLAIKFFREWIDRIREEFKSEELPLMIFRIQITPNTKVENIINQIPEEFFEDIPLAYNYDNLYFFVLSKNLKLMLNMWKDIKPSIVEGTGTGFVEETNGEFLVCGFTMVYENKQATHGLTKIDALGLEWRGESIFTLEEDVEVTET